MMIHWYDPAVRLTGRWTRTRGDSPDVHLFHQHPGEWTVTSAAGSSFELAFRGRSALLHFELGLLAQSYPHLWISVDGGARIEVPLDRYLRVTAPSGGDHVVRVVYKGGVEQLPRWYAPLMGCVAFIGAEAEAPAELPADERRIVEFLGDSITEGVAIDMEHPVHRVDQLNRPYQDDSLATYAALTAERLSLRPIFQAYGAVGLTRSGCASVPRAGLLYPWVCDGIPYTGEKPDAVVINHGANDRGATAEEYLMRYGELLDMVRANAPQAVIVALGAFCGAFDGELSAFIEAYNRDRGASVHFVSSLGWVPPEPLHPTRQGHETIADRFAPILDELLNGAAR